MAGSSDTSNCSNRGLAFRFIDPRRVTRQPSSVDTSTIFVVLGDADAIEAEAVLQVADQRHVALRASPIHEHANRLIRPSAMKADTASTSSSRCPRPHCDIRGADTVQHGCNQVDHRKLTFGQTEDVRATGEIGERRSRDIEADRGPLLAPDLRWRNTADEQIRWVKPSAKSATVHVCTCNVCKRRAYTCKGVATAYAAAGSSARAAATWANVPPSPTSTTSPR